jgi:dephospho-CoA kinase
LGGNIKLKKIAVTGGIASGKSTVCRLFEQLGAFVVSADAIVHKLLVPSTSLGKKIIAVFGDEILVDGELSRKKIAEKVFSSPPLLEIVEKLIHPEVQKVIESEYETACRTKASLFVAEVPLLYEAGLDSFYDQVIVIVSDEKTSKRRYRDDEQEFLRRSQRLMPSAEKIERADLIIENNGSLEDLRQTIQLTYNALKENI